MTNPLPDNESDRPCPGCGEPVDPTDRFCEDCGADLLLASGGTPTSGTGAPGACAACAETEIDADGYCTHCGHAQPTRRDRVELDLAGAAGVSDRGLRHHRNEDAMALRVSSAPPGSEETDTVVVVVCDGVSTSDRPDDAAKAAADAAAEVLLAAARAGTNLTDATGAAVAAAAKAVTALAEHSALGNAPACTFVSAVVTAEEVTVGWIGDSRAYWLSDETNDGPRGSARLTTDDSWAQQMISAGELTAEEAFADPRSHALIAWLAADAGDLDPHVRTVRPTGQGAVLVCSDGLWNYVWEPHALARAALPAAHTAPFAAATALTRLALEGGGHDNVTVAVVPFPPRTARDPAAPDLESPGADPDPPADQHQPAHVAHVRTRSAKA
jgi:serine/threonine protein phosphatase PrpC